MPPAWYNPSARKIAYPEDRYFTGLAIGERKANESKDKAVARFSEQAKVNLLSTISFSVDNVNTLETNATSTATNTKLDMQIKEAFNSRITTKIHFDDATGILTDWWWVDEQNKEVAVFAYLEKEKAKQFYQNQFDAVFSKINSGKIITDYLIAQGEQTKARIEVQKAKEDFTQLDNDLQWILACGCDEYTLRRYMQQRNELRQWIEQKISELSTAMSIYIKCNGSIFDTPCSAFSQMIKGELNTIQCTFVESQEQANWMISLQINVEKEDFQTNSDFQFVTISVEGSAYDTKKKHSYNLFQTEREGASKANGGYKKAADIIIKRERLMESVANDIIKILKSN